MRKNNHLLILFIVLSMLNACKEIDSTYKEFVVPGGIIYPGKAVSPVVYPGRNRVQISWLRGADPSVEKALIFWNNYADSVEVNIPSGSDTIKHIINDLAENSYSFFIKTYDAEGNSSVPVELFGTVYGDNYQASLLNRPITSTQVDAQGVVTINWGVADVSNGACETEVIYTNKADNSVKQRFGIDVLSSVITDYKTKTTFKYRTVFLPDTLCIDTFYTDFSDQYVSMVAKLNCSSASVDFYKE